LLVADDFTLIRQGIRALLGLAEGVEIVGEADTADDTVRLVRELTPSVVLMDQEMPGDCALAIRSIKQFAPETEVVVMTDRLDDEKAIGAVEAGATGYVLKDIPTRNLAEAIRSVSTGRACFHPEIIRKLTGHLGHLARARANGRVTFEGLTMRERDILYLLAQGKTDKEIAASLVVAEGTVKTHVRNILRKLEVRNRTQAVAHMLRKGLLT
jgi:two-component system NarL family response regulator